MENESVMVVCGGFCERLLDIDHLHECATCGSLHCGMLIEGKPCCCDCNPQPTGAQALDIGLSSLDELGLTLKPGDTAIVQDEYGTGYGSRGPIDFLTKKLGIEETFEETLEFYLPAEFAGKHDALQKQVREGAEFAHAEYTTENFAVAIKQFDCFGYPFTISVFHAYSA